MLETIVCLVSHSWTKMVIDVCFISRIMSWVHAESNWWLFFYLCPNHNSQYMLTHRYYSLQDSKSGLEISLLNMYFIFNMKCLRRFIYCTLTLEILNLACKFLKPLGSGTQVWERSLDLSSLFSLPVCLTNSCPHLKRRSSDQTQSPSAMVILYPSVWGQLTVGQTLYNSVQKQS